MLRPLIAILLFSALSACVQRAAIEPLPDPTLLAIPQPTYVGGSIYSASSGMALFEDLRARRVGDLITVILTERTDARKSASTTTDKGSSLEVSAATLFNHSFSPTSVDSEKAFEGSGSSVQNNSLTGSVTVVVTRVLANGLLLIEGDKDININQGHETLHIKGMVRPIDIQADNSVLSTRIASAQIAYTGSGALAAANREGWLSRLFGSLLSPL